MNRVRLVPVVVFAITALLVLKTIALVSEGGYVLTGTRVAAAQQEGKGTDAAPAEETAKDGAGVAADGAGGPADPLPDAKADGGGGGAMPVRIDLDAGNGRGAPGGAEAALLQRLGDRRDQLDQRERQLELRASLLAAAEKRLEERVGQLKALEAKLGGEADRKEEERKQEFRHLITMYESMKPKDAAEVFDRMPLDVLVDLVKMMKPRKVAPIVARMTPEVAERLTVAIATQMKRKATPSAEELPKIKGRPLDPK